MGNVEIAFCIIAAVSAAFIIRSLANTKNAKRSFMVSASLGIVTLVVASLTSSVTGIQIGINPLSLIASSTLGIPGVILMAAGTML